jgi:bifunctional lysine-specific demethylase and histidyl-hydroxylase NO66
VVAAVPPPSTHTADPEGALSRCVGDVGAFARGSWGQRPLLRERSGTGASFDDLLGLDDVDHLITATGLRAPAFRLVHDGRPLDPSRYLRQARIGSRPVHDLADPGRVLAELEAGATLVLQGLHRYWPPLAVFCRALERALTHPVQANAYLTPPTSAGLRVHGDAHDVFALQVHGLKEWIVYWEPGDAETRDITMRPGDALYLPRGTRHAARTVDAPSLHITIGVRATRWLDVVARALEHLDGEEAFEAPLPLGYADDADALASALAGKLRELARRIEKVEPARLADAVVEDFYLGRPPLLAGQLRDTLELAQLSDDTLLRRREGTVCAIRDRGEHVEVLLGDRRLTLPAFAEGALRAVAAADTLRPADLAGHLDEAGRLTLTRRLIREGLLRIDRDG